ncbi:MAG: DUF3298 and DUF4163 domain-containing protein [Lachnospiraceae bacterium]|nr:DUF3298 and DUF4163 domain-containing protein [Lachnospiraceae bacterium]
MKKKTLLLMGVVVLSLGLGGCTGKDLEKLPELTEEVISQIPEESVDEVMDEVFEEAEKILAGEEQKEDKEEDRDEDEEGMEVRIQKHAYDSDYEYMDGSCEVVEVVDEDHPELKKAVDQWFEGYVQKFDEECALHKKEAVEDNAELEGDDYRMYHSLDYSVEVTRADEGMLSLCFSEYLYGGGAHGMTTVYGVNFDATTGEIIQGESLPASVADAVKQSVVRDLEESTEEVKEMLFPGYMDTVEAHFAQGLKGVDFWFDYRGLVTCFQQYDIAPYAAGIIRFTVPYGDLSGFPEKWIPDGKFYFAGLSESGFSDHFDTDGDGREEEVYLTSKTDEDGYYSEYTLHVGEGTITLEEPGFYCEPYFIHSSKGNFFLFNESFESDWHTLYLYDSSLKKVGEVDASVGKIMDGKMKLYIRHDAFGTWQVVKPCAYDADGFHFLEEIDRIDNDPRTKEQATGITLKKDMKYSTDPDGEENELLEKGSVIYPIADTGSQITFVTEDRKEGYFRYEKEEDGAGRIVDGVPEFDLFDNMPYAS